MCHVIASLARFSSASRLPCVIAVTLLFITSHVIACDSTHSMAGFKRGGARGGFKKGFTNKRSSPDEDDSAPRASKKAKGDDDDDSIPVVPELKTDDNGDAYVSVGNLVGEPVSVEKEKKRKTVLISRIVKQ